jgi:hypothetical protein
MTNVYRTAEESGASLEELIVLCCIRLHAGTREADQLNKLLQSGVEWDKLIQLARDAIITPLLYLQLSTVCPTLVPPDVMEQLRTDFQANAQHNAMLIRDLLTIVKRFNREGIPVIPYKDPLSARTVYGNDVPRVYADLDVFIHEGDVARATEVLRTLGYSHISYIDAIADALDVAIEYHRIFAKDQVSYERMFSRDRVGPFDFANDHAGKLEPHWNFLPGRWAIRRNNEPLWARARKVPVGGTNVLSFSPEDSLLLACIHGTVIHGWLAWKLLNDVTGLINHTDLNWDQLVAIARQRGCLRILTVGLLLANEVAGAPLPDDIRQRLDHDPRTRAYVERVALQFFHRDATWHRGIVATNPAHSDLRYVLFMQERVRDKCRSLLRVMMLPVPSDVKMFPSLASHTRVFYLLHPALIVIKLLRHRLKPHA